MYFIYRERIPEWITSGILILFAFSLLWEGDTLGIQGYSILKTYGCTDLSLGICLLTVGLFRIIALYINGSWKRTPLIRSIGAAFGVLIFVLFAVGFFLPFLTKDMPPNTAWGTYLILAISDFYSSYKAGQDGRAIRRKH